MMLSRVATGNHLHWMRAGAVRDDAGTGHSVSWSGRGVVIEGEEEVVEMREEDAACSLLAARVRRSFRRRRRCSCCCCRNRCRMPSAPPAPDDQQEDGSSPSSPHFLLRHSPTLPTHRSCSFSFIPSSYHITVPFFFALTAINNQRYFLWELSGYKIRVRMESRSSELTKTTTEAKEEEEEEGWGKKRVSCGWKRK